LSDILCARRKCLSHARETVYLETVDGKLLEVNACTNHVDSLRRYIPGFSIVEKGMCVVKGCKERRRTKGCCDMHYQHVKQWKLTTVATDFVAYDLTAEEYVTFTGIMRKLDEDKIDNAIQDGEDSGCAVMGTAIGADNIEPPPHPLIIDDPYDPSPPVDERARNERLAIAAQQFDDVIEARLKRIADPDFVPVVIISKIHEEDTMQSLCPDLTEASPVDVECEESNPVIEAWQKAKLVPVEVIDERAAEIVRLEQENTALRERLAKVEQQTSVFVLDESDLRRRYNNMILGEQTVRELDGGAYVTVKLNNVDVHIDEFEVDRIKRRLRERAEKQISDALRLDVTVTPKNALFYLVWSPDGRTPPRYKHYSLEEAKKAANQMKSIHGGDFYAVAVIGDVSDNKDDIPF